jgi:hypothetical protein
MKWLFYGLMVVGGMFALAWYGAKEPKLKRVYGLAALGIWLVMFILANTIL